MKELKLLSQLGGATSIIAGSILMIKGLMGEGIFWAVISGLILLCSGVLNLIAVRLGVLDAGRLVLLRLLGRLGEKWNQEIL